MNKNCLRVKASQLPKDLTFAFSQIDSFCSKITLASSANYIDVLSFLDSVLKFDEDIRYCFLYIIMSLITHETLMELSLDIEILSQLIKQAQLSLTLFITSKYKSTLKKKSIVLLKNLIEGCHSVIRQHFKAIPEAYQNKLRVLEKIDKLKKTVKFEWNLIALNNINKREVNKLSFPAYTKTSEPFLPQNNEEVNTLVLDLDETLVHYTGQAVILRPGTIDFIKEMQGICEIVIFTSALPQYADYVMKKIDPEGKIKLRLFREHLSFDKFGPFKDLRKLGRNLEKVLIIDNIESNFRYTLKNGICIKDWTGDMSDNELLSMTEKVKGWFNS